MDFKSGRQVIFIVCMNDVQGNNSNRFTCQHLFLYKIFTLQYLLLNVSIETIEQQLVAMGINKRQPLEIIAYLLCCCLSITNPHTDCQL